MFNNVPDATSGFANIPAIGVGGTPTYDPYNIQNYAGSAGVNGAGTQTPAQALVNGMSPYAGPSAEQVAQSNARSSFSQGRTNVNDAASNAAGSFKNSQRNNILDYLDSLRQGQQGIDTARVNNTVNKQRGSADILGMVGRGIQSGGTMLANRNATDSSAAGAIAQAYGQLGQRQQSSVNNQFDMQNQQIDQTQANLATTMASKTRGFNTDKENAVNGIVQDAQAKFAALNDAAAGAGIGDRIAIEQEKEALRNSTLSQLAELDSLLGQQSGIQAQGQDQINARATQMAQSGQDTGNQFQYSTDAPTQLQGGPDLGQLPIYSNKRRGY